MMTRVSAVAGHDGAARLSAHGGKAPPLPTTTICTTAPAASTRAAPCGRHCRILALVTGCALKARAYKLTAPPGAGTANDWKSTSTVILKPDGDWIVKTELRLFKRGHWLCERCNYHLNARSPAASQRYTVQVLTELQFVARRVELAGCVTAIAVASQKHQILQRELIKSMTSRQAKLQEDTYFRVMRILQDNPDLTQRELAEKLGISVGGMNYCLKALMRKGLVKMRNFANSKNKFGYVYVLTPVGMAEKAAIARLFLQRKMKEYEALKAEIDALRAEVDEGEVDGLRKATR